METVDITADLLYGVERFKENPGFHVLATLVIGLVGVFSLGLLGPAMVVGYFRCLKSLENGQPVSLGDLFQAFDVLVPSLIAAVVTGLAVFIGCLFLFIPGLLLMAWPWTALYLLAEGETDGMAAVTRAFEGVKQTIPTGGLAAFVLSLVMNAGSLVFGIGGLVTIPIGMAASYKLGKQVAQAAA